MRHLLHCLNSFQTFFENINRGSRNYGSTSSTHWIRYASLFVKPRSRYQLRRANSKISYKVGYWHSSPPLRRETAAVTTTGWPDYHLQNIHESIDCCFFYLALKVAFEGGPYKAFSVRVGKYWNKLPASVVTALSVNVFKKRLDKVWTEGFPHIPHWLTTHLPNPITPCAH